ncbi:sulfatase-like hydrolase/transferase [Lewinella sp. JB7]|uniref:sulfatase n=1 Tax=Lewinella sp. JB7 TaxID=2962887 RepID=UPI0020C99A07|nr:sulfatase [Lewinella sp. JB7]
MLLICVDDLRPELNSFGVPHISSPHIDALAASGVSFRRHYVNAPSCGPSRYTLLTGRYGPAGNNALFQRAKDTTGVPPSMPEWFRRRGYVTVSIGKVSHHPGGRGGPDWNDDAQPELPGAWDRHLMPVGEWQHPRGAMHGLAHGEIREDAAAMDVYQSVPGDDDIYPDGRITAEALRQLSTLSADGDRPFFLAVGLLKPHLPFGAPAAYLDHYADVTFPPIPHPAKPTGKTTWHGSGEFRRYHNWGKDPNKDPVFAEAVRRHYAACVSYADAQVGKLLAELKRSGADANTIVVLWGDHGWHLGEHAIWGKHSLFEESLRSPLIVRYPGMEQAGATSRAVVETLDIFPTLCELTGSEAPPFAQGTSLRYLLEDSTATGHPAIAYTASATTVRTDTHRLILHDDGFVELYDHTSPAGETVNVADDHPATVESLLSILRAADLATAKR